MARLRDTMVEETEEKEEKREKQDWWGEGRASRFGTSRHELAERAADARPFSFSSKSYHNHGEFPRSGSPVIEK